jgi:hypothetical protein
MKPTRRWAFVLVETEGPGALTKQEAQARLFSDRADSIRTYYREVSYGLQDLDGDVLGPMTFDASTVPTGLCNDYGAVGAVVRPTIGHYDQYLYYFESEIKGCDWGGVAQLGMAARPSVESYFNATDDCVVLVQEPGHNFGMVHSSALHCTRGGAAVSMIDPTDPSARCTHDEYGNPFDPMGGGNSGTRPTLCYHMNGVQKAYEEWLDGCNMVKATHSGTFTIYPLEKPNPQMQVLEIPLPAPRNLQFPPGSSMRLASLAGYYLEMRAPVGLDAGLGRPRLFVLVANNLREARVQGNPNWLLDATPETPTFDDADLPVGQTFVDPMPGGPKFTLVSLDNSKAVVKVELEGVPAPDSAGEGTCLDETPYVPGVIRVPDAGPTRRTAPTRISCRPSKSGSTSPVAPTAAPGAAPSARWWSSSGRCFAGGGPHLAVEPAARMADDGEAMSDADEQRAHPRTGFGLEVSLLLIREKQPAAAILENISEGGCYFSTRALVKEGAAVSVVFGLRPRGLCAASGRVVRVDEGQGFGVRFNDINTYLREFVATLAATAPESRAEVATAIVDPEIHII